jgi:hypothetical protein
MPIFDVTVVEIVEQELLYRVDADNEEEAYQVAWQTGRPTHYLGGILEHHRVKDKKGAKVIFTSANVVDELVKLLDAEYVGQSEFKYKNYVYRFSVNAEGRLHVAPGIDENTSVVVSTAAGGHDTWKVYLHKDGYWVDEAHDFALVTNNSKNYKKVVKDIAEAFKKANSCVNAYRNRTIGKARVCQKGCPNFDNCFAVAFKRSVT